MVDDLDKILARRAVPQARSNLAARIIEASKAAEQSKGGLRGWFDISGWVAGIAVWVDVLRESLILPRPALAMATLLLFGLMLGLYFGNGLQGTEDPFQSTYVEDGFETGNWL